MTKQPNADSKFGHDEAVVVPERAGSSHESAADATPRETAGVTTRAIVRYVRSQGGDDAVDAVLRLAGEARPVDALEDETTWSTYEQKIALFEAAAEVLEDPRIGLGVGAGLLDHQVGASMRVVLRALGSPATVLRNVARVAPKFSTCCTTEALAIGKDSAVIAYWVHDGHRPHPMDCDYTRGTLSQASALFGLPPARVEHTECQVEGAPKCIYRLKWPRRSRRRRRADLKLENQRLRDELTLVSDHARALSATATDLVSPDDLDEVLARIVNRAATVIQAQHFLLAVTPSDGARLHLHHDGIPDDQLDGLLESITDTALDGQTGCRIVVDVASARHHYGRLAAVYPPGEEFFAEDRERLATYARHAAAALDVATALDDARRKRAAATAMLDLSSALARATTVTEVCDQLARAVRPVTGGLRNAILLWDDNAQHLAVVAQHGYDDAAAALLAELEVSHGDTPELASMLLTHETKHFRLDETDDMFVRSAMTAFGLSETIIVPIVIDERFVGVVSMSSPMGEPPLPRGDDLADRLRSLADQAATALSRASLLEQEQATVARLRRDEVRIRQLAFQDALTGLPNGRLIDERLNAALEDHRRTGRSLGVLFLDLDRFKKVNDTLGHAAGNELLQAVASRLAARLRTVDTIGRLGGDEFVVLLPEIDNPADAARTARRLLNAFEDPFVIRGREIFTSGSIGIALFPQHGTDVSMLLRRADSAMYRVKEHGRSGYTTYETGAVGEEDQLALESRLHGALDRGELAVHYQPLVDARTNEITGTEALVRWHDPVRGLVGPSEFIPLAEESGLIVAIDRFVLREACRQLASWHAAGRPELHMSVNIAPRHLQAGGLAEFVSGVLDDNGLDPRHLELEFTEGVAMQHTEQLATNVQELADLGIRLVIDDFGSAYAVWSHLKAFPFHRLKIDRSFIHGLPDDRFDASVVRAVIDVAHNVDVGVTAEGVETRSQADFLRAHGCDHLQGFLFSPAKPADELSFDAVASHTADYAASPTP